MGAYSTYSGAWAQRASTPTPLVPLKPPPDPQHLNPTDVEFNSMTPTWVDTTGSGVPSLPAEYTSDDGVAAIVVPGGPIDRDPHTAQFGVGRGPGLDVDESQVIRGAWGNEDLGAVAARRYQPTTSRADGPGPYSQVIDDVPGDGSSPQTTALKISGVGGTDDPYARIGKRIHRGWNRTIDMHRWAVSYRPMQYRNAYTAQPQPAVPNGNQYAGEYPTAVTAQLSTRGGFIAPQQRAVPEPWDQPITTDGSQFGGQSQDAAQIWGL
jgi:hypothetical protein